MKKIYRVILAICVVGILNSCSEESLDPTLSQSKDIDTSVSTVNDLQAILNGMYNRMSIFDYYGRDIIILGEVFADNAGSNANSNRFVAEARMDLTEDSGIASTLWSRCYTVIGNANIIINAENVDGDPALIDHIKGQAYVARALAHFDLVKFYGQQNVDGGGLSSEGVPYVVAFRDQDALFPARKTVGEVKDLAYADLDMAKSLLSTDLSTSKEYFGFYAADAIKARVANYFGEHSVALEAAGNVVNSQAYEIAAQDEFLSSFAIDQPSNSIFEIAANATDNEGIDGLANIYQNTNYGDVEALPNLADIYEDDDVRGVGGVIEYNPETDKFRNVGKYPNLSPYDYNIPVVRYEEIVLIYAEAQFETNSGDALTTLNSIPNNRGASPYTVVNQDNILLERRKELAFEGFRFHDLARTQMDIPFPDQVIQTHEGPAYGSYNFALPLPAAEVNANSNINQNSGY